MKENHLCTTYFLTFIHVFGHFLPQIYSRDECCFNHRQTEAETTTRKVCNINVDAEVLFLNVSVHDVLELF